MNFAKGHVVNFHLHWSVFKEYLFKIVSCSQNDYLGIALIEGFAKINSVERFFHDFHLNIINFMIQVEKVSFSLRPKKISFFLISIIKCCTIYMKNGVFDDSHSSQGIFFHLYHILVVAKLKMCDSTKHLVKVTEPIVLRIPLFGNYYQTIGLNVGFYQAFGNSYWIRVKSTI